MPLLTLDVSTREASRLPAVRPALAPGVAALAAVHRQLAELIDRLSDEQYAERPVAHVSGSIAGHVRHCLDHVAALLAAARSGRLDYDDRRRDTNVERSRHAALELIREQERQLRRLGPRDADFPVVLVALLASDLPRVEVRSTLGRELAFVLSHTIHHSALVAVIARTQGVHVAERFGYAPATLACLESRGCVR